MALKDPTELAPGSGARGVKAHRLPQSRRGLRQQTVGRRLFVRHRSHVGEESAALLEGAGIIDRQVERSVGMAHAADRPAHIVGPVYRGEVPSCPAGELRPGRDGLDPAGLSVLGVGQELIGSGERPSCLGRVASRYQVFDILEHGLRPLHMLPGESVLRFRPHLAQADLDAQPRAEHACDIGPYAIQ